MAGTPPTSRVCPRFRGHATGLAGTPPTSWARPWFGGHATDFAGMSPVWRARHRLRRHVPGLAGTPPTSRVCPRFRGHAAASPICVTRIVPRRISRAIISRVYKNSTVTIRRVNNFHNATNICLFSILCNLLIDNPQYFRLLNTTIEILYTQVVFQK